MRINKRFQKSIIFIFIFIGVVLLLEFIHIFPNKILISTYTNGDSSWSLRKIDINVKDISGLQNRIHSLSVEEGRFCPLDEGAGYNLYFYTFPDNVEHDFVGIQGCGDVQINNNNPVETNYAFWKFFYSVIPADPREDKAMLKFYVSN